MYNCVIFDKQENYIKDFISIPKMLYSKKTIMQNEDEERKILEEKHVLNKYFKQYKILVYDNEKPVGRCIVTIYHNSNVAYIGYFECINDISAANELFKTSEQCAQKENVYIMQGPVDSSFWIRYRLKVDMFDKKPYTGEPYNKQYYKEFFEKNGYIGIYNYSSKQYSKYRLKDFKKSIYKQRLDTSKNNGYKIIIPKKKDFDKTVTILYNLITTLYNDFPIYNYISEKDFYEIFKYYKYILDFSMFRLAYYKDECVGFIIGLPNYSNVIYGNISFMDKIKVFFKKIRSSNYVMLYMGVVPEHKGLRETISS